MYHYFFYNCLNSPTVVVSDESLTGDQLAQHGLPKNQGHWGVFDFDLEWALAEAAKYGFRGSVGDMTVITA